MTEGEFLERVDANGIQANTEGPLRVLDEVRRSNDGPDAVGA